MKKFLLVLMTLLMTACVTRQPVQADSKTLDDEVLQDTKDELVLVEFKADWCPFCQKMEPVMAELMDKYDNLKVIQVDSDKFQKEANVELPGIPFFVLVYNKQEIAQGNASPDDLKKKVAEVEDKIDLEQQMQALRDSSKPSGVNPKY